MKMLNLGKRFTFLNIKLITINHIMKLFMIIEYLYSYNAFV